MQNRRHFSRILFSLSAELTIEQQVFKVNIHDISLNGALLNLETLSHKLKGKAGSLNFQLDDTNIDISINISVIYQENNEIGVQFNSIDINSASSLRRLIELNLADDEQLHKELSQLSRT